MANTSEQQGQQRETGDLRSKRLSSSHPDLRPRMHVDSAIALSSNRASHIVADTERSMPFTLALPHRGQGINRLSALADSKDQRVFVHRHVPIAEFAGKFTLGRKMGEILDQVFADQGRVKRRTASGQYYALNFA